MTATLTPKAHRGAAKPWLDVDMAAGFGEFTARVRVNGPGSYRFELSAPGQPAAVFRSSGEVAAALYLSGQPVAWEMPTARIAELALAAATGVGPEMLRHHTDLWRQCEQRRHVLCTDLASRLTGLAARPCYPGCPQWWPDWRTVVA